MICCKALNRAAGRLAVCLLLMSIPPGAAAASDSVSSLDLSAHRGKVVVIDFWASWCAPCRRSFPWLDAMQRKYADAGLVVIGVNEDNAFEDAEAFLIEVPVEFRIVADEDGEIAREFELTAMPSTYLIGRDGKVAARQLGFKTTKTDEYETLLKGLLDRPMTANKSEPEGMLEE